MPTGKERGFTYLFLLFVVAMGGVLLASGGQLWWMNSKRDKEEELLFAGRQIRMAIESYYRASPQAAQAADGQPLPTGAGQYPRSFDELLEDRRHYPPLRHLRKVFVDPMTAGKEWGLIKAGESIIGVHSLADDKPLRTSGFAAGEGEFSHAVSYREWQFTADPSAAPTPQMTAASADKGVVPQHAANSGG